MAKASTSDRIVSAFDDLHRQLQDHILPAGGAESAALQPPTVHQVGNNHTNCTSHCCTPLLSGFRQLFVLQHQDLTETVVEVFDEEEEGPLMTLLGSRIDYLKTEYGFLRTFLKHIHDWTDADEVVEDLGDLFREIRAVTNEIADSLAVACENKYVSTSPLKLIDVLSDSLKKIENFKPQIEEAIDCLSGPSSSSSLSSVNPLPNYLSWISFVESIESNLEVISGRFVDHGYDDYDSISAYRKKLTWLRSFLGSLAASLEYVFPTNQRVKEFFNHLAAVANRAAIFCCNYWSKKEMDNPILQISGLEQEIDLIINPKFLELTLKFLRALKESRFLKTENKANFFLDYVLFEKRGDGHHWGLRTLIVEVISKEEDSAEDEQTLSEHIMALLREASPLKDVLFARSRILPEVYPVYKIRLWFFEQKIWLLKTEIFLREQVCGTPFFSPNMRGLIESHKKGLEKLKRFFKALPEDESENGNQILRIMEVVVREVASLYQSFQAQKITRFKVKSSLSRLVLKIVLFKAESSLMELLNTTARVMASRKDQLETFNEGLKLLTLFVIIHPVENKGDVELIFRRIEMVARGMISLYYTFLASKKIEDVIQNMILSFSDLLGKLKLIRSELRQMCPQFPRSTVPKTDGLGFIAFFLGNLEALLKRDPDSIAAVKHYIKEIMLHIQCLRSLIWKVDSEHPKLKDIGKVVIDVAYEVEYAIDSIEVGMDSNWQHCLSLYYLLEDIRLIKKQATKIYEEETCNARVNSIPPITSHTTRLPSRHKIDKWVVPLTDQEEVIVDRLTRGSSQRDIIPIVGMPGLGKTTLAKKVYDHPKVTYYFHIRAWCSVSQEYEKRELLLEILSNISGLTDSMRQMTDEDLELKLYQQLKKNVYLIVMDDIWNIRAWKDLESSLPDDGNGSRILITSRLHDVATKAKSGSVPHPLRMLSDDESWKLLEIKIFDGRGCPEELLVVGKKIAQNCKGLPLAIVAIAGLLERIEKKQDRWEKIVESLSSQIIDDPETRCKEILQLSYKQLPVHLKTCFLYFGAFLEDRDILICKLIWLWISEGFIQKTESKSLEDVAEDYIMELIDRSLVIISKRRSNGKIKACRVHDMLRDLCLSKAKEENFFHLITRFDEPYASFNDLDYGDDFDDHFPSNPVTYEVHRLCICLKRKLFVMSRPAGPCTRSLIVFATNDTYPRCPYDILFIFEHFKLLRVLDLECINVGSYFPGGIELLVQLRYLALSGDIDTVPPSIANLWKLETFLVKGLKGKVVLPSTFWRMASLRHVHINNHVVFSLQDEKLRNFSVLDNLVTLSSPSLSYGKDAEGIIRRLPNLKKLKCRFYEWFDQSSNRNQFPQLSSLTQLESLKIFYVGRTLNPGEFDFPMNLKKLTLSNFRLQWNQISAIGRLENLEIFKLLCRAFEGQRWDMTEGEFLNLKFLELDNLNITQWNATSDHLPSLQHLSIRNCKDLEEVPFDFTDIPTLEIIEVQWCGQSTEKSVRRIEEEGIEGLKILINHSDSFI